MEKKRKTYFVPNLCCNLIANTMLESLKSEPPPFLNASISPPLSIRFLRATAGCRIPLSTSSHQPRPKIIGLLEKKKLASNTT